MRILKDQVLHRARAFSPEQLVDFIVRDFSTFYEDKLLKVSAGRPDKFWAMIIYTKEIS